MATGKCKNSTQHYCQLTEERKEIKLGVPFPSKAPSRQCKFLNPNSQWPQGVVSEIPPLYARVCLKGSETCKHQGRQWDPVTYGERVTAIRAVSIYGRGCLGGICGLWQEGTLPMLSPCFLTPFK